MNIFFRKLWIHNRIWYTEREFIDSYLVRTTIRRYTPRRVVLGWLNRTCWENSIPWSIMQPVCGITCASDAVASMLPPFCVDEGITYVARWLPKVHVVNCAAGISTIHLRNPISLWTIHPHSKCIKFHNIHFSFCSENVSAYSNNDKNLFPSYSHGTNSVIDTTSVLV